MSWLEELEARLEQQLQAFLASNPAQDALLRDQETRDHQAALIGRRRQLQLEAQQRRSQLLTLVGEIHQWRERTQRARTAGAIELAQRAEAHAAGLMEQGRRQWQELKQLGETFLKLEGELKELEQRASTPTDRGDATTDLEQAWARFETEQELAELRRSQA